jgi:hypothetical protein
VNDASAGNRLVWVGTASTVPSIEMTLDLRTQLTVWVGGELTPSVYWQLADPDFSLVEIGLERTTGRLTKLAVPLYRGELGRQDARQAAPNVEGVPQFDIAEWQPVARSTAGDFKEVFGRIRIDVGPDGWWTITMFDDEIVHHVGVPDLLSYSFNVRNELCGFSVNVARSHSSPGLG